MRYLARRLLQGLPLLFGVSLLTFFMTELAPGDLLDEMRLAPGISPETVQAVQERLALDRPLPVRYASWLAAAVRGDLGVSLLYDSPVAPLLVVRARNTLLLTGTATLVAWLLALPLGVWIATGRGRPREAIAGAATSVLMAIPELVLALALVLLAAKTGWFPTAGMTSLSFSELAPAAKLLDILSHLALPTLALVAGLLPVLLRHVQAAVGEVLDSPFLRTARSLGVPERSVLFRHTLRAAANPLVSLLGVSIAGLLSASLLVEIVMGWPGIGPFLLDAILARDVNVVIGTVIVSTLLLLIGNFLADLLLFAVDPRIRES